MGWFLTKKKKARATRSAKTRMAIVQPWNPQRTLAVLQVMGALGLLLALTVGWRHLGASLAKYAQHRHSQYVTEKQVVLVDAPEWIAKSTDLRRELQRLVAAPLNGRPWHAHSLAQAHAALASSAWIQRLERVHRLPNGQILVHATYRQPLALIETADGYHFVDTQGVQLPWVYRKATDAAQIQKVLQLYPLIIGAREPSPGEGEPWPGQDVQAGLDLVRLLQDQPYRNQIQAFDVSQRDGRNRIRLVLRTKQGVVNWGLPPGEDYPIEPDAQTKKLALARAYVDERWSLRRDQILDIYTGNPAFRPAPQQAEGASDARSGYTWSR